MKRDHHLEQAGKNLAKMKKGWHLLDERKKEKREIKEDNLVCGKMMREWVCLYTFHGK